MGARWRQALIAVAAVLGLSSAGAGAAFWYDRTLLGFPPPPPKVLMGLVWTPEAEGTGFLAGAELARSEINAAGGLLGRTLEFEIVDVGEETPVRAGRIARRLAGRDDLVAVSATSPPRAPSRPPSPTSGRGSSTSTSPYPTKS